jgi:hypothetical protein
MATQPSRTHAQSVMRWLIGYNTLIGYDSNPAVVRPMPGIGWTEQHLASLFFTGKTLTTDCSGMVCLVCKFAGFGDPTGNGYDGQGNSNAMYEHLQHYTDPRRTGVGAICVFGPDGADHAAMVMDSAGSANPLLFSHGSADGPKAVWFTDEAAAHRSPAAFLNIGPL